MNSEIPASRTTQRLTDAGATVDHGPTCARIYEQIESASSHRVKGIQHCIGVQSALVADLQASGDMAAAREAQNKFRLMKRELSGEKLLKAQVMTHFDKRCSAHFQIPHGST